MMFTWTIYFKKKVLFWLLLILLAIFLVNFQQMYSISAQSMPKKNLQLAKDHISEYQTKVTDDQTFQKPYLLWTHRGRLGNNMFQYASSYCLAIHSNHTPTIPDNSKMLTIFKNLNATKVSSKFQKNNFAGIDTQNEQGYGIYDSKLINFVQSNSGTTHVGEYLQSYKYFMKCNNDIEAQFEFIDEVQNTAHSTMMKLVSSHLLKQDRITPAEYRTCLHNNTLPQHVTYIGVHVRAIGISYVPDADYFAHGMDYFREKYGSVLFLVCTDSPLWVETRLLAQFPHHDVIHVSQGNTTYETDFAILVKCHHSLISGGTFSWWAGWLAAGEVIYPKGYAEWHTKNQGRGFYWHDYYPGHWTPLN